MNKLSALAVLTVVPLIFFACSNVQSHDSKDSQETITNKQPEVESRPKASLVCFNEIEETRIKLSAIGIGELSKWGKFDDIGFMSITNYFQFGKATNTGIKNKIAIYLDGSRVSSIDSLKLVLNINNPNESQVAVGKFITVTNDIFNKLSLKQPQGLKKAINSGEYFLSETDTMDVRFDVVVSKIRTLNMTIIAK